ncbi:hypothetical protein ACTXT7_017587, partial [Hymenolepis weldensis]
MEEDLPMSSNKIRLHPIPSSPNPGLDGWPRIFIIMSHQTSYGCLLTTHQVLTLSIITFGPERGVVEKGVNKYPHNTKSSSLMEAIARGMED